MLTRSFDRAFSHLVRVFKHYHDVWRSPDNISELGSARWNLEEARADMRRERDRERTRTQTAAEPSDRPFLKMAVSEDDMGRLRFAAWAAVVREERISLLVRSVHRIGPGNDLLRSA